MLIWWDYGAESGVSPSQVVHLSLSNIQFGSVKFSHHYKHIGENRKEDSSRFCWRSFMFSHKRNEVRFDFSTKLVESDVFCCRSLRLWRHFWFLEVFSSSSLIFCYRRGSRMAAMFNKICECDGGRALLGWIRCSALQQILTHIEKCLEIIRNVIKMLWKDLWKPEHTPQKQCRNTYKKS